MASEVLLSNIIPFAGSGLVGYAIGFALLDIALPPSGTTLLSNPSTDDCV
jgi:hypothetical protein